MSNPFDPAPEETDWEVSPDTEEIVELTDETTPSSTPPLNAPTPEIITESRLREIEEKFRAEVERERREREALEQRLHHTQAWGNQRHQEATFAQQMVEASRLARQEAEALERQRRELSPPVMTPEEREALGGILDPDLLERKLQEYTTWGARQALAQMAPHLQRAEETQREFAVVSQILPSMVEQTRSHALAAALSRVVEDGDMTYEEAESLVPEVYANFERYGGYEGAIRSSMDPNVVATGLRVVHLHRNGGVKPVGTRQAPKPRTLGSSTSPASNGKSGNGRIQVTAQEAAEIRKVEQELGRKLPIESIRNVISSRRKE